MHSFPSYGGIFESRSREYTLDDFHALQLDKMDRFMCLKKAEVVIGGDDESSNEDETDSDNEDDQDDQECEEIKEEDENDIPSEVKPEGDIREQSQKETQREKVKERYNHQLMSH